MEVITSHWYRYPEVRALNDDKSLKSILRSMNRHLPSKRYPLSELLEQEEPHYVGRDGVEYTVKRKELETMASYLTPREQNRLKIPIYVSSDTKHSIGAWIVRGKVEVKLVSEVVGREPDSEKEVRLFFPHLSKLRDELPTATTVFFMP